MLGWFTSIWMLPKEVQGQQIFPLVGDDGSAPPHVAVLDVGESWSDTFVPRQLERKQESVSRCIDLKIQLQSVPVHKYAPVELSFSKLRLVVFNDIIIRGSVHLRASAKLARIDLKPLVGNIRVFKYSNIFLVSIWSYWI